MVVHENAHEWFGNNITVKDVADSWVQEGFAGYAEELVMGIRTVEVPAKYKKPAP